MIWSISSHKTFKNCPRQWYYKSIVSDGKVKKIPERVEVTRLSKLKTIDAWRGEIVDRTISEFMVLKIKQKQKVTIDQLIRFAKNIFNKQYDAITGKWDGWKPSFGFIDIEFGREIKDEKLQQAWNDIELSFTNLLNNESLLRDLYEADLLLVQCSLMIKFGDVSVKGTPDLIAFFKNKPPKIFDWKVHTFGTSANEEQLVLYAYLLKKCNPHINFPSYLSNYKIQDIALSEVQLIANEDGFVRNYQIDDEKIEELEQLISNSILEMYGASDLKKYGEIGASDFDVTTYDENCINCPFKKVCNQVEL
jgi:hypothetical protein